MFLEEFGKRQKGSGAKSDQSENDEEEHGSEEEAGESDKIDVDYVNSKDKSSWTALMYAAREGHTKVCEVLIDAGANIEIKNSKQLVSHYFKLYYLDCRSHSCIKGIA